MRLWRAGADAGALLFEDCRVTQLICRIRCLSRLVASFVLYGADDLEYLLIRETLEALAETNAGRLKESRLQLKPQSRFRDITAAQMQHRIRRGRERYRPAATSDEQGGSQRYDKETSHANLLSGGYYQYARDARFVKVMTSPPCGPPGMCDAVASTAALP